jgi:hypothetical protein
MFKGSIFDPRMQLICETERMNVNKSYEDESRNRSLWHPVGYYQKHLLQLKLSSITIIT